MEITMNDALMQTELGLPGRRQGKVRDLYDASLDDGREVLIIVATDRISAFDVVMANGLPGKGVVLTQISRFWFDQLGRQLGDRLGHHLISTDPADIPGLNDAQRGSLTGRVMIGRKTRVVPIECVVRGYLTGSGWADYKKSQAVCGIDLPAGLNQCQKLPEPIFTAATKAETGHDENITFDRACEIAGTEVMTKLRSHSLELYRMGHDHAAGRGIILADTKFEFGVPVDEPEGDPILIDEVLTPDSSRFWPADQYQPGRDQPSFDKQYVRNYLAELVDDGRWDKTPPGPTLPDAIVRDTMARYMEAYRSLTGKNLEGLV